MRSVLVHQPRKIGINENVYICSHSRKSWTIEKITNVMQQEKSSLYTELNVMLSQIQEGLLHRRMCRPKTYKPWYISSKYKTNLKQERTKTWFITLYPLQKPMFHSRASVVSCSRFNSNNSHYSEHHKPSLHSKHKFCLKPWRWAADDDHRKLLQMIKLLADEIL